MARRRYQRGELKLRGKVWYGRWREDVKELDGTVRRIQKNEPIGNLADLPTQKLARRELESRISDVNSLTYRPRSLASFEQFAKRWRESVLVNEKRSAQSSDESILSVHLEKRWGTKQLKEIEADPEGMQVWAASLKVAPKTQRNIVGLMSRMLDIAIEWGYIKYNPLARVRLKPLNLEEEEFALSLEQMRKIIDAAPEPYKSMYWILGETGIRAGEVLALGFEHIDLEKQVIYIRRKVWRGELETVKSRKGVRSFAISKQLTEHLKAFADGRKSGFMFTCGGVEGHASVQPSNEEHKRTGTDRISDVAESRSRGEQVSNPARTKLITYDHALKEVFQPLLETLKIPLCGFHAFRHGNATLMDQLNVPAKTRMDRLGHEKMTTTMGYTHAVSEDDRAAATRLGEMLTERVQ